MGTNIIFLDFDGVMGYCDVEEMEYTPPWCSRRVRPIFNTGAVEAIRVLCESLKDIRFVLSTTWRLEIRPGYEPHFMRWYCNFPQELSVRFVGSTPNFLDQSRDEEISSWLTHTTFNVSSWVCINHATLNTTHLYKIPGEGRYLCVDDTPKILEMLKLDPQIKFGVFGNIKQ